MILTLFLNFEPNCFILINILFSSTLKRFCNLSLEPFLISYYYFMCSSICSKWKKTWVMDNFKRLSINTLTITKQKGTNIHHYKNSVPILRKLIKHEMFNYLWEHIAALFLYKIWNEQNDKWCRSIDFENHIYSFKGIDR